VRHKNLIILALFHIGLSCFSFINQPVAAGDMSDVKALIGAAEKQQITVPDIKDQPNAKETADVFTSKEYQKRLQEQINALRPQLYPDIEPSGPPSISRKDNQQNAFLMQDERIYLFVSSSMPQSTLKTYAADLDKLRDKNIIMVMRGFVGGVRVIKPTLAFIDSVLIKDQNCDSANSKCDAYQININIDPALFLTYGVQTVPAIVYARGVNETEMEKGQGATGSAASDAYIISGDVPFEYALAEITKESKSSQIENILKKLRRGFY